MSSIVPAGDSGKMMILIIVFCLVPCSLLPSARGTASRAAGETPLDAAKRLWAAVAARDARALRDALHCTTDAERQLVAAMADLLIAGERLKRAAREKFGDAGEPMGRRMIDVGDAAALERAAVIEKGDLAIITIEGAQRPLTFRRTAEGWKLVVTGPEGGPPEASADRAALVAASARAINAAADEIRQGRHATPEAASSAVEAKLHAVMLEAHRRRGSTQPAAATRPVRDPPPEK